MISSKNLLIVDGYNILNNWGLVIRSINFEAARDDLGDILADYAGYKEIDIILVFDAHRSDDFGSEIEQGRLLTVYTKHNETADSRIEGIIKEKTKKYKNVYVATADYTLQLFVLGEGALRITPNELKASVELLRGRSI
jgi:predicted RNA-binding protein with PIN domain